MSSSSNNGDSKKKRVRSYSAELTGVAPTIIRVPAEHDVLCGRGNDVKEHTGNIRFRQLVLKHKVAYVKADKAQKAEFAKIIVRRLQTEFGARFLQRRRPGCTINNDTSADDSNSGGWFEIEYKHALDKTRQALREGAPVIEQHLSSQQESTTGTAATDTPTADTPTADTPTADTPTADTPTTDTKTADKSATDAHLLSLVLQHKDKKHKAAKRHLLPPEIAVEIKSSDPESTADEDRPPLHKKKKYNKQHNSSSSSSSRVSSPDSADPRPCAVIPPSPKQPRRTQGGAQDLDTIDVSQPPAKTNTTPPSADFPRSPVHALPATGSGTAATITAVARAPSPQLPPGRMIVLPNQLSPSFSATRQALQEAQLQMEDEYYHQQLSLIRHQQHLHQQHLHQQHLMIQQQQQQQLMPRQVYSMPSWGNGTASVAAAAPAYWVNPAFPLPPMATVLLVPSTAVTAPTMVTASAPPPLYPSYTTLYAYPAPTTGGHK